MERGYKKLVVWQEAIHLNTLIFQLINEFPQNICYSYADQMQRASLSIASNIAEGYGRFSRAELKRFSSIAFGSAMELECQLISLAHLNIVPSGRLEQVLGKLESVLRLLNAFIRSLTRKPSSTDR